MLEEWEFSYHRVSAWNDETPITAANREISLQYFSLLVSIPLPHYSPIAFCLYKMPEICTKNEVLGR